MTQATSPPARTHGSRRGAHRVPHENDGHHGRTPGPGEGEALFGVDRLLTDPTTGTRALHRTLIPFATAEGTALAEHPDAEPAEIYTLLAEAGHDLSWAETTRARMPLPDERATLQLADAVPVIHTTRTTLGRDDRPLIVEELTASGDRAQLTYRITADGPKRVQPTA